MYKIRTNYYFQLVNCMVRIIIYLFLNQLSVLKYSNNFNHLLIMVDSIFTHFLQFLPIHEKIHPENPTSPYGAFQLFSLPYWYSSILSVKVIFHKND